MAKRSSLSGSTSHIPLMDTERDIQDTLCSVIHLPFYQQVILNDNASPVYSTMVKSGVLFACSPKTHLFPEFIYWLVSVMYLGKCFVMNFEGENVLQVSTLLICQALCYPESESSIKFSDNSLVQYYDNLVGEEFNQFMFHLKPNIK